MTPSHPRRGDEAGVSNVLGAILMFGLLVLTLTVIQVEFVPVWTEDREARQMQALVNDLSQLKSDLARQAGNDSATSITDTFVLRNEGGFSFFQSGGAPGATATFTPAPLGTGIFLSTTSPVQVLRRNGQNLFGLDPNSWETYVTEDVEDVGEVSYLLLRVTVPQGSQCGNQNGHSATLNIYDAADVLVAAVHSEVKNTGSGSDCAVAVQTRDGLGNELNNDNELFTQNVGSPVNVYFDLLEPQRLLAAILAQSDGPFTLEFEQHPTLPLIAAYQIAYEVATTGGAAGSGGLLDPLGFNDVHASGHLSVAARNERFPDQTYTLEHGAIVLSQEGNAVMAVAPDLELETSADQASVTWTVAGLSGANVALGSPRVAAQAAPTGEVQDVWLLATSLDLTIPTAHPAAWQAYLQDQLNAEGWLAAQYSFVNPSTSSVTLRIEGPDAPNLGCTSSNTASPPCSFDVSFRFRISDIELSLHPAG